MTRASLREYATIQRERYLHATRAEKGRLLDEVVTVAGVHRKAAIRLLRRIPPAPTARPRAGRPRFYGPAVAAAAQVLWEGARQIGPRRLHPFVPELLARSMLIADRQKPADPFGPRPSGRGSRAGRDEGDGRAE